MVFFRPFHTGGGGKDFLLFVVFITAATKLWEGNVFTPVCQSFCSRGGWGEGEVSVPTCTTGHITRRGSLSRGGFCLGVSVQGSLSRGVSVWGIYVQGRSLSSGVSVQGGLYPGGSLPRVSLSKGGGVCWGISVQGVSVQGVSVQGGLCWGDPLPDRDPPGTVTSGRYASYWNAYLFDIF